MVKIIYASLTGNTEMVAERFSEFLDDADIDSGLFPAEEVDNTIFLNDKYFVIAVSTWNDGQLNELFTDLYEGLLEVDLTGKRFAFIGLGDMNYGEHYYCKGMKDVRKRVLDNGGTEMIKPFYIDGDPAPVLDNEFQNWNKDYIDQFQEEDNS
jgi:flavodoxin